MKVNEVADLLQSLAYGIQSNQQVVSSAIPVVGAAFTNISANLNALAGSLVIGRIKSLIEGTHDVALYHKAMTGESMAYPNPTTPLNGQILEQLGRALANLGVHRALTGGDINWTDGHQVSPFFTTKIKILPRQGSSLGGRRAEVRGHATFTITGETFDLNLDQIDARWPDIRYLLENFADLEETELVPSAIVCENLGSVEGFTDEVIIGEQDLYRTPLEFTVGEVAFQLGLSKPNRWSQEYTFSIRLTSDDRDNTERATALGLNYLEGTYGHWEMIPVEVRKCINQSYLRGKDEWIKRVLADRIY